MLQPVMWHHIASLVFLPNYRLKLHSSLSQITLKKKHNNAEVCVLSQVFKNRFWLDIQEKSCEHWWF